MEPEDRDLPHIAHTKEAIIRSESAFMWFCNLLQSLDGETKQYRPIAQKTIIAYMEICERCIEVCKKQTEVDLSDWESFILGVVLYSHDSREQFLRSGDSIFEKIELLRQELEDCPWQMAIDKSAMLQWIGEVRKDVDNLERVVKEAVFEAREFPVEKYADRVDRGEKPDKFLLRVYGMYFDKFLTPPDIKKSDPRFYNSLSVWCSENNKKLVDLLPHVPFWSRYYRIKGGRPTAKLVSDRFREVLKTQKELVRRRGTQTQKERSGEKPSNDGGD